MRLLFAVILSLILSNSYAANAMLIAYYANWTSLPFSSIPAKNIDVVNYAFAAPEANGSIRLTNPDADIKNFNNISTLKRANPNLKILVSIGGWTLSKNFSAIAANATFTKNFVNDILELMKKYPELDGVDIDWEYPVAGGDGIPHSPNDVQNYVKLLKEIRIGFDTLTDKHRYITIATPSHNQKNDGGSVSNFDLHGILQWIDWINVMDYDIHQSTSEPHKTNNDAALYQSPNNNHHDSIDDSINDYSQQLSNDEMNKVAMGIPLYGYAWRDVENNGTEPNHPGLYATANSILPNPYISGSDGTFTYTTIIHHLINDQALIKSWNADYQYATFYSPTKKVFLTFDDIQTVQAKANYIKSHQLRGAMFWELSNDSFDENSLIYHACQNLKADANTCVKPTPALPQLNLELTNNDPNNEIIISLVTADNVYYAFPQLAKGSSSVYTDLNSPNVNALLNAKGVRVLMTTKSKQVWCPKSAGTLNLSTTGSGYHHVQVNYAYGSCAIN